MVKLILSNQRLIVLPLSPFFATRSNVLVENIPQNLRSKLLFQPAEGFHFTIQWSPEEYLTKIDIETLLSELKNILNNFSPINGNLFAPFFGRAGLFGMLKTETDLEIPKIRSKVHQLWKKFGLPPGLNLKDYDLAYISLVRYLGKFNQDEIKQFKDISLKKISNVILSEARVVLNDKIMNTNKTKILEKIILRHYSMKLLNMKQT